MERILVADDDERVVELLRRALERKGYLVTTARDGQELLEVFSLQGADAVIVDMEMPRKNGPGAIRELRSACPDIPVIALSGAAEVYESQALNLGADAFVAKPFVLPTIMSHLRELLV